MHIFQTKFEDDLCQSTPITFPTYVSNSHDRDSYICRLVRGYWFAVSVGQNCTNKN